MRLSKEFLPVRGRAIESRVAPQIAAVTTLLPEKKIVNVPGSAVLHHPDQLMLRAVACAHTRRDFVPDDQVLLLGVLAG